MLTYVLPPEVQLLLLLLQQCPIAQLVGSAGDCHKTLHASMPLQQDVLLLVVGRSCKAGLLRDQRRGCCTDYKGSRRRPPQHLLLLLLLLDSKQDRLLLLLPGWREDLVGQQGPWLHGLCC